MQIQICKRFCFNFAYCDHGNERYTMGVNFLQISCMLICKNETNLVNVIFTMTLLITLRVRKSVFSSRDTDRGVAKGGKGGDVMISFIIWVIVSCYRKNQISAGQISSKTRVKRRGVVQPRTQGTLWNESTLVDRGHVVFLGNKTIYYCIVPMFLA